jgi:hypothetical protein
MRWLIEDVLGDMRVQTPTSSFLALMYSFDSSYQFFQILCVIHQLHCYMDLTWYVLHTVKYIKYMLAAMCDNVWQRCVIMFIFGCRELDRNHVPKMIIDG